MKEAIESAYASKYGPYSPEDAPWQTTYGTKVSHPTRKDTYQRGALVEDDAVLKVFVAPEFFFRGPNGAYPTEDLVTGKLQLFPKLVEMVSAPKYKGWLFVLGTVIAADEGADGKWNYYNVAPIYEGGPNGRRLLAFKKYVSGVDFLKQYETLDDGGNVKAPEHTSCLDPKCFYSELPQSFAASIAADGYEIVADNVFESGNVTFGIEICLDHLASALRSSLAKIGRETVDVQIVTSNGMSLSNGAICTPAGGPAFLSDGVGRTEWTTNAFGQGSTAAADYPQTIANPRSIATPKFNVGFTNSAYSAQALELLLNGVGLRKSATDDIKAYNGLPECAQFDKIQRVDALPSRSLDDIAHLFSVSQYQLLQYAGEPLVKAVTDAADYANVAYTADLDAIMGLLKPTVDIYYPIILP